MLPSALAVECTKESTAFNILAKVWYLGFLGKPSKKQSGQTWDIVPSSLPPTHPSEFGTHMRKKFRRPNMSYIDMAISYTVWNTSLILSHPPTLLGQCPKFDRIYFLMASLINFVNWQDTMLPYSALNHKFRKAAGIVYV